MALASIDLRELFDGRLRGEGLVASWSGRALRTFTVEFHGQRPVDADVMLLDEIVRYADGRLVRRNWTVEFDPNGRILGFDANRSSRLRAYPIGDAIRLIYDRPLGAGAEIAAPRVVMHLSRTEDGALRMEGGVRLCGLLLQRTEVLLQRLPDSVRTDADRNFAGSQQAIRSSDGRAPPRLDRAGQASASGPAFNALKPAGHTACWRPAG